MSGTPSICTLDASVGITLFLHEPLSDQAHRLVDRQQTDAGACFYVPDIFYAECGNSLWKAVRRLRIPDSVARDGVARLMLLDLTLVPTPILLNEAVTIALAHDIAVYDACYIAASVRFGAPLVTVDEHLLRRLKGGPYDIRWLGDVA